jgi:hypothetical protein
MREIKSCFRNKEPFDQKLLILADDSIFTGTVKYKSFSDFDVLIILKKDYSRKD